MALEVVVGSQVVPLFPLKPDVVFSLAPWPMGDVLGVGNIEGNSPIGRRGCVRRPFYLISTKVTIPCCLLDSNSIFIENLIDRSHRCKYENGANFMQVHLKR